MDSRAQELIRQGDNLFSKRLGLLGLWQEIALNFYVIRADFQSKIVPGDDLASHLSTSYPLLAHREMTDAVSAMLRPRGTTWFGTRTTEERLNEGRPLDWLEWATKVQYQHMYDRDAGFVRAAKQGDADFAAFGQTCLYVDVSRDGNKLLYRNYHLRDVAFVEDYTGRVNEVHRKWKCTARDLAYDFGLDKLHPNVTKCLDAGQNPFTEFEVRHVMVPTARALDVPANQKRFPFRSYFIDISNEHVIEDMPSRLFKYVMPRWVTVSGSPYAYSPATIAALPDARLIQAMTYTLLDATQKAAQPPMIGQAHMIKSDLELWSGGTTWVDAEYDERLGEALRPIPLDLKGLPIGVEQVRDARRMISEAFFLNKISLPPADREMTAYETAQRIQEYIRQALPLFEPMEQEYNGALCEMTFDTLQMHGAFGPAADMPSQLSNADIEFKFISPLQEKEERQNSQIYLETKALLADAASLHPELLTMVDSRMSLRDAIKGAGAPSRWIRDDDEMDKMIADQKEQLMPDQVMNDMERGGQVVEQLGNAAQAVQGADMQDMMSNG